MATLENACIRNIRDALHKGDAATLSKYWTDAERVRGGNEDGVFETEIRRDTLAYTIVRHAFMHGGRVFGGFVRSHLSGRPYNDIDIMLREGDRPKFVDSLGRFVCFVLSLKKKDLHIEHIRRSGGYGSKIRLTAHPPLSCTDNQSAIKLEIDISSLVTSIAAPSRQSFAPVSIGSCLQMQHDGISFRDVLPSHLQHWDVIDIVEYLCRSEDVKLYNVNFVPAHYAAYYWQRVDKMRAQGWKLHSPGGGNEPRRPDAATVS